MPLASTKWLYENISSVKIIDSTWHMPSENRNSFNEYQNEHIPNAVFFDIDENSDQESKLPHMLPSKKKWEAVMSSLGISNEDRIVIYDNSEVISSCRLWYTFIYFGHNPSSVKVLNGGLYKWKIEKLPLENNKVQNKKTIYTSYINKDLVIDINSIKSNIKQMKFRLIDGRSQERFDGKIPEPREGLKSGSIPNSVCLPFKNVINKNKTFKKKDELTYIYKSVIDDLSEDNIVFTCGSGITSCVLALAYSLINNNYKPKIYDGSWAEYGKIIK